MDKFNYYKKFIMCLICVLQKKSNQMNCKKTQYNQISGRLKYRYIASSLSSLSTVRWFSKTMLLSTDIFRHLQTFLFLFCRTGCQHLQHFQCPDRVAPPQCKWRTQLNQLRSIRHFIGYHHIGLFHVTIFCLCLRLL